MLPIAYVADSHMLPIIDFHRVSLPQSYVYVIFLIVSLLLWTLNLNNIAFNSNYKITSISKPDYRVENRPLMAYIHAKITI